MNRFFALALVLAVTVPAASAADTPANYDAFGVSLLQRLSRTTPPDQNVFISPLSIGVALSMAAEGASGDTRAAMLGTLHISGADPAQSNSALIAAVLRNHDARVGIANALWTRDDAAPASSYVDTLAHDYSSQARALRFGDPSAAETINAWTKAHTLGLIDRIVDRTSARDFVYLTNALAFDGKWTLPFKPSATHKAPFTDASGKTHDVDMMTNTGVYREIDAKAFRAIRMPYGDGGFAAYILLPNDRDANALLQRLDAEKCTRAIQRMHDLQVQLSVPRFTAAYETSLVPVLKAMGMAIAFSNAADFSGIHHPPPPLEITSVQHASYVRVDEAGTVAAAATSVGISRTSIEVPQATFVVDRPFVFAIRDERSSTILFAGVINSV